MEPATSPISIPGVPDNIIQTALSVPIDFFIIFIVFVLFSWQAFKAGSARLSALATALVAALFTFPLLPDTYAIGGTFSNIATTPIIHFVIFAALVGLFYFVMRSFMTESEVSGGLVQGFLAGGATTVLLLAVWQQIEYTTAIWEFGPLVDVAFSGAFAFWWIVGALVLLAIARRGSRFY